MIANSEPEDRLSLGDNPRCSFLNFSIPKLERKYYSKKSETYAGDHFLLI